MIKHLFRQKPRRKKGKQSLGGLRKDINWDESNDSDAVKPYQASSAYSASSRAVSIDSSFNADNIPPDSGSDGFGIGGITDDDEADDEARAELQLTSKFTPNIAGNIKQKMTQTPQVIEYVSCNHTLSVTTSF